MRLSVSESVPFSGIALHWCIDDHTHAARYSEVTLLSGYEDTSCAGTTSGIQYNLPTCLNTVQLGETCGSDNSIKGTCCPIGLSCMRPHGRSKYTCMEGDQLSWDFAPPTCNQHLHPNDKCKLSPSHHFQTSHATAHLTCTAGTQFQKFTNLLSAQDTCSNIDTRHHVAKSTAKHLVLCARKLMYLNMSPQRILVGNSSVAPSGTHVGRQPAVGYGSDGFASS